MIKRARLGEGTHKDSQLGIFAAHIVMALKLKEPGLKDELAIYAATRWATEPLTQHPRWIEDKLFRETEFRKMEAKVSRAYYRLKRTPFFGPQDLECEVQDALKFLNP